MPPALTEIRHEGIRILGVSLAGEETAFVLPEMNLAFDIGRCHRAVLTVDHVFLSHGHMDHAAGVAYYFAQRIFLDNHPGNLFAPEPLVGPIRRLLEAWTDIDGRNILRHQPPPRIEAVYPGQDVVLRRDLLVRPFEVNHPCRQRGRSVPSLGYAAVEVRHKLLEEFQEMTGPQLVELKKRGVAITRRLEIPLVAYCGDTAPGDFFDLPCVRDAKVLLLECTFIEPDHRDRARAGYHMHIAYLRDIVPALRNEKIILSHLSRRTTLLDARQQLQRELGEAGDERVSFLLEHRRRSRSEPEKRDGA